MPETESSTKDARSDEELTLRLAAREPDALAPLYARYAPLVFHIASQSLDAPAAEDIEQDVFLALWGKAGTYDPRRGPFRPWLLQIAHCRVLNELRRRSRRPLPDLGADDRPGTALAVIALHELPSAPIGTTYTVWVRIGAGWITAGNARPADHPVRGEERQLSAVDRRPGTLTRPSGYRGCSSGCRPG